MPPAQSKKITLDGLIAEHRNFLQLAEKEKSKSDDPKAKSNTSSGVGCVIVVEGKLVSQSANVLPPMLNREVLVTDEVISEADRYHIIEHAERAAIFEGMRKRQSLKGGTIYCTRYPCSDCARAICWSGIKSAVFSQDIIYGDKWSDSQIAARRILLSAGIDIQIY